MSDQIAIELQGLSKSFVVRKPAGREAGFFGRFRRVTESVRAVDGISFSIRRGERVAFIGPNGAGKSTTLKMLSGVLHPDSGAAQVLGFVPWKQRRQLGFRAGTVFGQRSQLWYHLPPRETFSLLSHVYEVPPDVHRERLRMLVDTFELGQLLDKPVRQLSLGERMRCEIVASLLHAPEILFLDEPTIGLDVSAKATIRTLLSARSREDGATLLLTSHDTGDIEEVCDRVIVIHGGRILSDESVESLRRKLATKRVTLHTDAVSVDIDLPGVRVIEREPHRTCLQLEVDKTPVAAVVQVALEKGTLRDLSIEDPPLDEVIRTLYERAEGKPS